jgi:LruC domain-containing protein
MNILKTTKIAFFFTLGFISSSAYTSPTEQNTVDNGDGTFTYTQKITESSTSPHYIKPSGYGFDEYSWFNEDYGWQHNFADYNNDSYQIQSATLLVRGWDVDSEATHGQNGEYDGIAVDGIDLDPGLLQGTNNTWSETFFDVPVSSISDDGLINVFLDIDMNHNQRYWATTLDYSLLTITYLEINNSPPYQPEISFTPNTASSVDDDLIVAIIGPTPTDPDNDSVTYHYRWFVDVGQGYFVDDTFAGKSEHTGNTVLSSQTNFGERWRVTITPTDSNGIVGTATTITFPTIGDSDNDGVSDADDIYPLDPLRAFKARTPTTGEYTLAFEDLWPKQGDYDLNDLVLHYYFETITDNSNKVKQINFNAEFVSRGAAQANGFALSFDGMDEANVENATISIEGNEQETSPEAGHSGELVFVLMNNLHDLMPSSGEFEFFNTMPGDIKSTKNVNFSFSFIQAVNSWELDTAPYNPFIFSTYNRGLEVHLPNQSPTDLADMSKFGSQDDASLANIGKYYVTSGNLPWALNITSRWKHPFERVDITTAYPQITPWAQSSGLNSPQWFSSPSGLHCWKCQ